MINYNRHIFDNINNEEKAYWLGFIVADGYLNSDKHMLRIKLGNKDKQHLIKFIKFNKLIFTSQNKFIGSYPVELIKKGSHFDCSF